MICANRCVISGQCNFGYFNALQDNHIEYVSVSLCSYSTTASTSIWMKNGNQTVIITNHSMNSAKN